MLRIGLALLLSLPACYFGWRLFPAATRSRLGGTRRTWAALACALAVAALAGMAWWRTWLVPGPILGLRPCTWGLYAYLAGAGFYAWRDWGRVPTLIWTPASLGALIAFLQAGCPRQALVALAAYTGTLAISFRRFRDRATSGDYVWVDMLRIALILSVGATVFAVMEYWRG